MRYRPRLLWLHMMGNPLNRRNSVVNLETILSRGKVDNDVLIWDVQAGSPKWLREVRWDGIFLGPTFLSDRYADSPRGLRKLFGWVANSSALKVALPQDEYDSSAILDEWLSDWGTDVVLSIFPEHSSILYPNLSAGSTRILRGFTGFVSNTLLDAGKLFYGQNRNIDVSYRAQTMSKRFGTLGQLKVEAGNRFLASARSIEPCLSLDISTNPKDTLYGDAWYELNGNSRFVFATPSGSSVLDSRGDIRRCLKKTFRTGDQGQVQECIPDSSRSIHFEALSPRHLEAAILGAAQVCVSGHYGGILVPGKNALELHRDFGNLEEVVDQLKNEHLRRDLVEASTSAIMCEPRLTESGLVNFLISLIETESASRVGKILPDEPINRRLLMRAEKAAKWAWLFPRFRRWLVPIRQWTRRLVQISTNVKSQ